MNSVLAYEVQSPIDPPIIDGYMAFVAWLAGARLSEEATTVEVIQRGATVMYRYSRKVVR